MLKFAIVLIFMIMQPAFCEPKFSDLWEEDGKGKVLAKDMNLEQKTFLYESLREDAVYKLENIGKKCSELKNMPEHLRKKRTYTKVNSTDICFSTDQLPFIYRELGEYDKEFEEMRKYHETGESRYDAYKMQDWLYTLISKGCYHEAWEFFPEFANSVHPTLKKEEVIKRLEKGEKVPEYLSRTIIAEAWEKILAIKNKPDDPDKLNGRDDSIQDTALRMHHYFYSKDNKKRAEALEFYGKNKVKFMIEKARKTWKGEMKNKAEKYLEALQKSTTE